MQNFYPDYGLGSGGEGSTPSPVTEQPRAPVQDPPPSPSPGAAGARQGSTLQSIQQLGQLRPAAPGISRMQMIPIVGQIEGHVILPPKNKATKYEHIIPQLVAVEQNPKIKGLLLILNTVGGDIEAGLAIAEMIHSLSKPTVSLVLGGGHSIGAPIAVSADYSFIAPSATITIHPIRLTGLVIGVPQTYEYLDKMQDRVINFIVENSNITEERLRDLMFRTGELVRDVGTVLIGPEAVRVGMIDEVGGLAQAVAKLEEMMGPLDPEELAAIEGQVASAPEGVGRH
ncbi:MAG: hypothetical protein GX030_06055 [Firmicutes bacterium]|nr:hypothetical protein [Bacillota bacterium]